MAEERLWQSRHVPRTGPAPRRRRLRRIRPWAQRMLVAAAWVWLVGIYGAVLIAGCFLVATLSPYTLPPTLPAGPTLIYAADGSLLARLDAPLRLPITLGDVPPPTVRAILAAEDIRFFHHHGLDWRGLLRAGWAGVRAGAPVQGGSTITQQLVRFQLLDDRQPLRRKVHEMVLAIRVERAHTKREILERYLNTVYFGDGACGIGAAAERYFGKPVGMLTLAESALLAGCIRAPSEGDPRRHLVEARGRQRATLTAMRGEDWITEEEYIAALRAPLLFAPHPAPVWCCPYAVEAVRRALLTTYGRQLVYQGGLSVYTTIQPRVQAAAEATVVDAVRTGAARGVDGGAVVAVEPETGAIRALAGGADFTRYPLDHARLPRPPGAAFAPFVYLAALQRGGRLTDTACDAPVTVAGWTPHNVGDRYRGALPLHAALAASLHSVAVRLTQQMTPYAVVDVAGAAGITSPLTADMSIAVGESPVTPLEMAGAFATMANGGVRLPPTLITAVRHGECTLFRACPQPRQQLDPEAVARLTAGLEEVIRHGTGRRAALDRPAAGTPGTSRDDRDAWFVGYTPQLSAAVWLGNDTHRPLAGVAGGGLPAQAWAAFMRAALQGVPPAAFHLPPAVQLAPSDDAEDGPVTFTQADGPLIPPWWPAVCGWLRR